MLYLTAQMDGFIDCNDLTYEGEDESVCGIGVCPAECYCLGHAYACILEILNNIVHCIIHH